MTLQEYVKQAQPLAQGSVEIEESDLSASWEVEGGRKVQLSLYIGGRVDHHAYFVLKNDRLLWTITETGRMDSPSVFKLKEPL